MKYAPLALFLFLAGFLLKSLYLNPRLLPSNLLNKPLPQFSLESLTSPEHLSNQNVMGRVSLLNVWATWCLECRKEHEFLMELAHRGVRLYGLDYKDDRNQANAWLQALGNPYQAIGFDKHGLLAIDLGVYGAPETFLIDKEGIIRYRHVGVLDEHVWAQQFKPRIKRLSNET